MNILFLDLDGTVRKPQSSKKFISEINPFDQVIIEGAEAAIAHYKNIGWQVIGVSNQAGISAGHRTLESVIKEMRYTLQLVPELSIILFCPDFDGMECWWVTREDSLEVGKNNPELIGKYRKPNPGMIELVLKMINPQKYQDEVRQSSLMVGDRPEDKDAADGAGVAFEDAAMWRQRFLVG